MTLRAGQQIPAGPYLSTIMPDMDFETYSEAGLLWNGEKWTPVTGKGGISATGAWAYSEHPTTDVMCLYYDLKDGLGQRAWIPRCPPPQDMFDHLASGGLIEAHNAFFEYAIWTNVCVAKMGWPAIPIDQMRCSASKARRWGLPGALEKVSKILGCAPKDMEGSRIMRTLSTPRKPTKNKPYLRCTPQTDPDKFNRLYKYCGQDIATEAEVSQKCPDLTPYELEVWKLDQRINARGVHCNRALVEASLSILDQATTKYCAELHAITGGLVSEATSLPSIKAFCAARGFYVDSLDKEHLPIEIKRAADARATDVHRVLQIRSILGSASVAKLHAMLARMGRDDRIRDLFTYCGAERTSRWSGGGVQPQNMPGGFESQEETERAISLIMTRNLSTVEAEYPDPVEPLVKTLRSALCAAPGHELIASDYSAIEARVLAVIAGEQWRIDVFKEHGKIYEMSASKITGIPFEEFERHKRETGNHHPMRKKVGKVSELACLAPDTQVLTKRGYVAIVDVRRNDLLWDGVEWTTSDGSVYKGVKRTIEVDGVRMTPNHPVSLRHSWMAAEKLASNGRTLLLALAIGSENLPFCSTRSTRAPMGLWSNALAGTGHTSSRTPIFIWESLRDAPSAVVRRAMKHISRSIINMRRSCRMMSIGGVCATGLVPLSAGAITRTSADLRITGGAVSASMTNGVNPNDHFSNTYSRFPGGMTRLLTWIESTRTAGTNPETCGSSRDQKTASTSGRSSCCKKESMNLSDVYDIVNAGPRNRFTIKTENGHLLVHNSGYQGSVGAWKAFGADEFMTDEEILANVKLWRAASPAIVKLWYGLEEAAVNAVLTPGQAFAYRSIAYQMKDGVLYCKLPSGRLMAYHQARVRREVNQWNKEVWKLSFWGIPTPPQPQVWSEIETYGGKLCENVVQAASRDLLADAMLRLDRAGYLIVLHVHDEIVAEVSEGWGSVEEFEAIMGERPAWAADWPLKAAGGWRGKRFRKD